MERQERDSRLKHAMARNGIVDPQTTLRIARKVNRRHGHMPLSRACALLEKETSGGANVWGHDRDRHGCIPPCGGAVTRKNFAEYKKRRRSDGRQQGCGPTQLTFFALQDRADELGGCWKPNINMYVGFSHLAENIERNGVHAGMRLYNGSGPAAEAYAHDLRKKEARWLRIFEAALAAKGRPRPARPARVIARGQEGHAVVVMTRRLSYLSSTKSGRRYLDGKRRTFDKESELALRRFQAEHGLKVSGRFGPRSAAVLARAVAVERRRRAAAAGAPVRPPGGHAAPPGPGNGSHARPPNGAAKASSTELLATLERLDATGDRVRDALVARSRKLEKALARERKRHELIQRKLHPVATPVPVPPAPAPAPVQVQPAPVPPGSPVAVEPAPPVVVQPVPAPAEPPPVATGGPSRLLEDLLVDVRTGVRKDLARERQDRISADAELRALIGGPPSNGGAPEPVPEHEGAPAGPVEGQPGAPAEGAPSAPAPQAVPQPSLDDLIARLVELDGQDDHIRALLASRYEELERRLVRAHRRRRKAEAQLRVAQGLPPVPPKKPRPRRPTPGMPAPAPGGAGAAVIARLGDRGPVVRQSKVALIRYLRAKRPQATRKVRRALMAEVRSPRRAKIATGTWRRAVRSAQKTAGQPITGRLDGELRAVLRPHWPRDSVVRRMARSTPAWRAIPGQLSRNFNLREFASHDGVGYVGGLMREQGLSKKDARRRAKGLARRLEDVRRKEGNRPLHVNSAYRSKRHNASVGGARNSAHLRGFAADVSPPRGVSLGTHKGHMRACFESGIGFYPKGNFVHGDFDRALGRREWSGP